MTTESVPANNKKWLDALDENIRQANDYEAQKKLDDENFYLDMARRKLPLFNDFVGRFNSAGSAFVRAERAMRHAQKGFGGAAKGFSILGLVGAVLDFVEIPLIYLAAWITGTKIPFNLTNNAKWAYSTLVLALTILSFVASAIAVPVWATLSLLAIGESLVTLGYMWHHARELKRDIKATESEIQELETGINTQIDLINEEVNKLGEVPKEDKIETINQSIQTYKTLIDNKALAQQKLKLLKKEQSEISPQAVIGKSARVIFSLMSLVGFLLFVVSPAVGAVFLGAVAGLALTYFVASQIYKLPWSKLGAYFKKNSEEVFLELEEVELQSLKQINRIINTQEQDDSNKYTENNKNEKQRQPETPSVSGHSFFAETNKNSPSDADARPPEESYNP